MRALLAIVFVMIGLAAPAYGDPDEPSPDPGFIAALQAAGIGYSRPEQAVFTAQVVCKLLASGKPSPEILDALKNRNQGLTTEHATVFVGIAVQSYCPDQLAQPGAQPGE